MLQRHKEQTKHWQKSVHRVLYIAKSVSRYVLVLLRVLLCAKNITKHEKFRSVMYMVFTLSIIMCFLCIVRYTGKTQENRAILNDDLDSSKSVHRHAFSVHHDHYRKKTLEMWSGIFDSQHSQNNIASMPIVIVENLVCRVAHSSLVCAWST